MINRAIIAAFLLSPATVMADGGELFADFCQNCHGNNAEVLRSFDGSLERFQQILEGDTIDMPDFYGMFSPEDIAALYEYVTGPTFKS